MDSVREEERANLSRDLHDSLGQELTAIKLDISWIERRIDGISNTNLREALARKIEDLYVEIDESIGIIRDISSGLLSLVLDDFGLFAAVETETREWQNRTNIMCVVEIPDAEMEIDNEYANSIFRIFQETMTNVARHSEASEVKIIFKVTDDTLKLSVSDNGRGVKPDDLDGINSLGLLGMRERTMRIGGVLEIRPLVKGTQVDLDIPLGRILNI